jgi:serine/threonine protein kinase
VDHIVSRGGGVDYGVAFCALLGVARAVAALHAAGLMHRDLKPENVLLDARQRPYVADVGFARSLGAEANLSLVGTPCYMAPEVMSREYTRAVDVWSFGMLLYSLCTARVPFDDKVSESEGDWHREVQKALRRGERVRLGDEHALFRPLFERCTAHDPAQRPTMDDVAESVLQLARDSAGALPGFDYEELLRYDAELRLPRPDGVDHGTIEEVCAARERIPLAATVYGALLHRGIIERPGGDDGIDWLKRACGRGCRIAWTILRSIQDETTHDMGLPDAEEPPPRPPSLLDNLLKKPSSFVVL